ncbi:MFS transporter [Achromobacter spanius]|uniref:MFS transporter n=1 Tax=Achromobacter spanius TaxID=217203 RepID=UPI00380785BF
MPLSAPPVLPPSRPHLPLLLCLSLSMLLASLGTSIANVGLPAFAQAFGAPFQSVQWVVLAYLLAITTAVVSAGRLGDLIGRRRLMLGGIAWFTAASVLCAAAPGLWTLVAARAAQGLGAAVLMTLAMAFAGEATQKGRSGSAMGLLGTMSAAGTALGPTPGRRADRRAGVAGDLSRQSAAGSAGVLAGVAASAPRSGARRAAADSF